MADFRFLRQIKNFRCVRIAGHGLKSQRCHKFHRTPGHDHLHFEAGFNQQPHQLDCFIAGDPAGNAEDDFVIS